MLQPSPDGRPNIVAIASGSLHSCAVTSDGGVKCWGSHGLGKLGETSVPIDVVSLDEPVVALTAGEDFTCALTGTGGVRCWGSNARGQLGDGTWAASRVPVDVAGLSGRVTAITAGVNHACALMDTGGVTCWGADAGGQLPDGSMDDSSTPVEVIGLGTGIEAIAAAGSDTCALTQAHGVKCWGSWTDTSTPADVPGLTENVRAIGGGNCVVTTAGGLRCWYVGGDVRDAVELGSGFSTIASSAAGNVIMGDASVVTMEGANRCVISTDGGLACWGLNSYGELGDGTTQARSQPVAVPGFDHDVAAVALGAFHTCALTRDGRVFCWGSNVFGQLGREMALTGQAALSSSPLEVDFAPPPSP